MSDQPGPEQPQMTEEEMRRLEAELDRIDVDDVILQTIVSLINIGARKGAVGAPPELGLQADPVQLGIAVDAARALLAVVEPRHGDKVGPIRDALSQLQLAYAQTAGGGAAPQDGPDGGGIRQPPAPPSDPAPQGGQGGAGEAQRSGRLWVPGQ